MTATSAKQPEFKRYAAKRYLEHIASMDRRMRAALYELRERTSCLEVSGVSYDAMGAGQPSDDAIPNALQSLYEALSDTQAEVDAWREETARCAASLRRMGSSSERLALYADILRLRYISGASFRAVAEVVSYEPQSVQNMMPSALECFYGYMPEEWKANLPNAQTVTSEDMRQE